MQENPEPCAVTDDRQLMIHPLLQQQGVDNMTTMMLTQYFYQLW